MFDGSVRTTIKTDNHHLTQEMRRPHSSSLGRGRCQITSRLIQIKTLLEDGGIPALRHFHTEMSVASPERLDLLDAHDMLVTATLDLDAKVARHFGNIEGK
ncbi:hypothetical protein [Tateyamaria sp.]|uniref:hypothetical protein n=1 Tax=Tateyamaria sp. TaxID=1929288 RepID=UPI003B2108FC